MLFHPGEVRTDTETMLHMPRHPHRTRAAPLPTSASISSQAALRGTLPFLVPFFSSASLGVFPFSPSRVTPNRYIFLRFQQLEAFPASFLLARTFFPFSAFSNSCQGGRISGHGARALCTSGPETLRRKLPWCFLRTLHSSSPTHPNIPAPPTHGYICIDI